MTLAVASPQIFSTIDAQNIGVFPPMSECTIAQAATFLDVSEGFVNELLNAKRVMFRQENGERLIEWNSLSDYGQTRKRRRAALAEMVRMNQEMGLYDD